MGTAVSLWFKLYSYVCLIPKNTGKARGLDVAIIIVLVATELWLALNLRFLSFDINKLGRTFVKQSFLNGQIFIWFPLCFLIRKLPHDLPGWVTPNPSDTGGSEDDDEDAIQDELEDQTASEVRGQMQISFMEYCPK